MLVSKDEVSVRMLLSSSACARDTDTAAKKQQENSSSTVHVSVTAYPIQGCAGLWAMLVYHMADPERQPFMFKFTPTWKLESSIKLFGLWEEAHADTTCV